jgi:hypothetical protein
MTTKIQKDFMFQAGLYLEGNFIINAYQMSLDLYVESEVIAEQNIAMDRLHYFLYETIENSIFVNESETDIIEQYTNCGLKVSTLPSDPHDQVIGIMMMLKLNSILEDRLFVTTVVVTSKLSDGARILCDIEDSVGPFHQNGWWNDNNLSINNLAKAKRKKNDGKVVKLFPASVIDWADIGLAWKPKTQPALSDDMSVSKIHVLTDKDK